MWQFSRNAFLLRRNNKHAQGVAGETYLAPIDRYYKNLIGRISEWEYKPKISILVPIYKVKTEFLKKTILSVVNQLYTNWELCLVDDASGSIEIESILKEFKEKYPRQIKIAFHEENQHISVTSNTALGLATGEYIGLLDHDDVLYPNALAEMVRFINYRDKPDILYSDEQIVNGLGEPVQPPFFKPDYLPFLHLSVNYTTHFSVYSTKLIQSIGGFRKGVEGSQDFDLMLRAVETSKKDVVHVPMVLYQWRAHEDSTAHDIGAKNYAISNGEAVVKEALKRRGREAQVEFNPKTLHYDIHYDLIDSEAAVSIIIPNKNSYNLLKNCIDSIRKYRSGVPYEIIIVDNQSNAEEDKDIHLYYESLNREEDVVILNYDKSFNFASMNNLGVSKSKYDYVLLLNNDTEVLTDNWLKELVSFAQFPEVGSVGAKLLFEDSRIQHGGMIFMDRAIAGHGWINRNEADENNFNCLNTAHECSGVTAACLCIKKEKYLEVGGLDEFTTPNGWGDVEFAIKLLQKGLKSIYTPSVKLYHYESPSRGASLEYFEKYHLIKKYGWDLMNDIFSHPFFIQGPDFTHHPDYMGFIMNDATLEYIWEKYK